MKKAALKPDPCGKVGTIAEVAAVVAHEMRTPLTAIKNSIYYLKMIGVEGYDPKIAPHISLINEKLDFCVRMLTNLQSFVQSARPIRKEVRLNDILTQSASLSLPHSKIKIVTDFGDKMPPVMADPFQLRQVFDNIIRNAIEAMLGGGTLTISAKARDCCAVVEFKDTGAGIPSENMDKVFTPLFSTTPHNVGLGLTISKQFVEANDGTIDIESEPGKGMTVRIKLPYK